MERYVISELQFEYCTRTSSGIAILNKFITTHRDFIVPDFLRYESFMQFFAVALAGYLSSVICPYYLACLCCLAYWNFCVRDFNFLPFVNLFLASVKI